MKMMKRILPILMLALALQTAQAGNPDRRGEAGAYQLVMNGWGRSSGFFSLNGASVKGLEAERINVAGLAMVRKTEIAVAYSLWMQGSGVGVIHAGVAQNFKKSNVVALHIQALNFGAIERTTTNSPEGGLGTYKPNFLNIGLSYARAFSNNIYGGVTVRMIAEGLENVNAFGFALDAGLQYVTGPKDNIHFGVALRNIGGNMTYKGDGFTYQGEAPEGNYQITIENRSNKFQLPTQLNISAAYDIWFGKKIEVEANKFKQNFRFTIAAQFTSNAFGSDHYGPAIEFGWKEMVMIRAAYRMEEGVFKKATRLSAYTGLAAGLTVDVPFKKDGPKLALDYSFRATDIYQGTHSIGLRFNL